MTNDKHTCPLVQLIEDSGTDPSLWFPEWRRVTMLESEQLSAIRDRHAAAHRGPWEWSGFQSRSWLDVADLLDTVGELRERERVLSAANDDLADYIIRELEKGDDAGI